MNEQDTEALARAMCVSDGNDPDANVMRGVPLLRPAWTLYLGYANTAVEFLRSHVAETMVLVSASWPAQSGPKQELEPGANPWLNGSRSHGR